MKKILAIKGHPTRGKEVIEILEMLGGINDQEYIGTNTWKDKYYYLDDGYIRAYDWCDGIKFTLEEFLEKYPYKVGDKVYIKVDPNENCLGYDKMYGEIESAMWVEKFGHVIYKLKDYNRIFYKEELHPYKEDVSMEDNKLFGTICDTAETKSCTVSLKAIEDSIDSVQFMQSGKIVAVRFNTQNYENEVELQLDDYEIEVRDGKTYAVKKKPKYPTTYAECYDEGNTELHFIYVDKDERDLYESFIQLIRCRNAYWKIAGEEMGLGKPWKPDWKNTKKVKYGITLHDDIITKIYLRNENVILAFPTEEMRDIFYKNFKNLIEECKELL